MARTHWLLFIPTPAVPVLPAIFPSATAAALSSEERARLAGLGSVGSPGAAAQRGAGTSTSPSGLPTAGPGTRAGVS